MSEAAAQKEAEISELKKRSWELTVFKGKQEYHVDQFYEDYLQARADAEEMMSGASDDEKRTIQFWDDLARVSSDARYCIERYFEETERLEKAEAELKEVDARLRELDPPMKPRKKKY